MLYSTELREHVNDVFPPFEGQDGICHVPISDASHRKALHPYTHPSSLDDLTSFISINFVWSGGFEPPTSCMSSRYPQPSRRRPHLVPRGRLQLPTLGLGNLRSMPLSYQGVYAIFCFCYNILPSRQVCFCSYYRSSLSNCDS